MPGPLPPPLEEYLWYQKSMLAPVTLLKSYVHSNHIWPPHVVLFEVSVNTYQLPDCAAEGPVPLDGVALLIILQSPLSPSTFYPIT